MCSPSEAKINGVGYRLEIRHPDLLAAPMPRFYEPDLGTHPDSPFARDASNKLVRRSYWLDMNDRSLVMVFARLFQMLILGLVGVLIGMATTVLIR